MNDLTREEFNQKIGQYQTSDAPIEVKEKAIQELQSKYPEFTDLTEKFDKIKEDIKESAGDTYDVWS